MRRRTRTALLLAGFAFAGANGIAFMQARAMTHFSESGTRTKRPEELGALELARVLVTGVRLPRPADDRDPSDAGLPFETLHFENARGIRLEAWHVPGSGGGEEGPVVLAFHGYGDSKSALLPCAQALHALGFAVLLVDFYGCGGSSGTDTSLGHLEAEDVAAAMAYAHRRWPGRPIVLYGFSMGGAAVLRAIAEHGVKPQAIVLEATFDSLWHTTRNRFHTLRLPATPFAEMLLFWGGVQWRFNAFALAPARDARSVRCPVLLLHGGADARVPPSQAARLQRAFGERARFVLVPGVPHAAIAAERPGAWRRDVGGFLGSLASAPAEAP